MKKLFLVGIMSYLALTSCKKDGNNVSTTSNYFPLSVGNYWVYNVYQHDLKTSKDSLIGTDSLYVKRDTIIKNQTYYVLKEKSIVSTIFFDMTSILRDSIDCTIRLVKSDSSSKYFYYSNFTDTLCRLHYDGTNLKSGFVKIYKISNPVDVPVGTFSNEIENRRVWITSQKSICNNDSCITSYHFAPNVGIAYFNMIYYSEFIDCSFRTDFKLVRYKIN